ncbi:uncharacterized protein LOC125498785 [Beta vulgaris subsp. vulgaris]|uniref:uncharacterized protein LOC125498785 n=1 Tax=Beta vulgaris subsp. vulgaris TaxID=3555 RepID=UPI0020366C10|nr:uncharacterized protein LOC125498785 [Beta vulgaris subsp. vulgaris]
MKNEVIEMGPVLTSEHDQLLDKPYTADEMKKPYSQFQETRFLDLMALAHNSSEILGRLQEMSNTSYSQCGAFVKERFIVHNIMVCQDLVRQYGRKKVKESYIMKLHMKKAYNTIDWDFLEEIMYALKFSKRSKRGFRQGDPISLFLFVICMEYLSRLMRKLESHAHFKYHPSMLQTFKLFSSSSGLQIGESKSELRKILVAECNGSIEKMRARFDAWSNRDLSYDARLQLINLVSLSIHIYWAQIFILHKYILKEIEKIYKSFLWCGEQGSRKPGNVASQKVCTPRQQGGLGVR